MATEPDLIAEVEALLANCPDVKDAAFNIERALFADAVERERDSPFWGNSKKLAHLYARAPDLLRRLVEEVKELRATILRLTQEPYDEE